MSRADTLGGRGYRGMWKAASLTTFFVFAWQFLAGASCWSGVSVLVTRFGAIADGKTDSTAAFQSALDAVSAAGGGTVFVPAPDADRDAAVPLQYYRFEGSLVVPAGVTLRGPFQGPFAYIDHRGRGSQEWTSTPLWGAILGIHGGAGQAHGIPFISLEGPRAALKGLTFLYPDQDPTSFDPLAEPIAYPWTVATCPGASDVVIENCAFANPYQMILLDGADRHLVRHVTAQPLLRGIRIDDSRQGRLDAVEYHWYWTRSYQSGGAPFPYQPGGVGLEVFALTRAIGFEFRHARNEVCRRLQSWGIAYPFWIEPGQSGEADVEILSSGLDLAREGINVVGAKRAAVRAVDLATANGFIFPSNPALRVWPENTGTVTLEGVVERLNGPTSYVVSGTGDVTLRATQISMDTRAELPAALRFDGQHLRVHAIALTSYGAAKREIQMGESAGRLEVIACQTDGSLDIRSQGVGQLRLFNNRHYSAEGSDEDPPTGSQESRDDWEIYDGSPNAALTLAVEDVPNVVDVRDFGASTTLSDNTSAFQSALDTVAHRGGGTVFVPPGTFDFQGRLFVYANTTLQGSWSTSPRWPMTDTDATILSVRGGARALDVASTSFITLCGYREVGGIDLGGANITVRDLVIYYPDQLSDRSEPTTYPWAIRSPDPTAFEHHLIHVFLVNPYLGVDFTYPSSFTVRELYGQPIHTGWTCRGIYDWPEMADVHFGPYWADAETPIGRWILAHGTAFDIFQVDGFFPEHLTADGYRFGFRIRRAGNEGAPPYGAMRDLRAVRCRLPLSIESTHWAGLAVVDSLFATSPGDTSSYTARIELSGKEERGYLIFSRCGFSGAPVRIVGAGASASDYVVFDRCQLSDWTRPAADAYAIRAEAGIVTVTDSRFDGSDQCLYVGRACLSAIATGNTSNTKFGAVCESGRCTIADN